MTEELIAPPAATTVFRVPSLDGIRAISILLVFLAHTGVSVRVGGLGVTVFFFLSGYLITTLLRREFVARGAVDYRSFYWRRVWRILPPMYAALTLGVVASLVGLTSGQISVRAVTLQALHLTNYAQLLGEVDHLPAGTSVMWSLAIEEHFYLVFPVMVVLLMRHLRPTYQALVLLVACVLVLCWRAVLVEVFDVVSLHTYLATDARIDAILFGCIMGLFMNPMLDRPPVPSATTATIVSIACVAIVGVSLLPDNGAYRSIFRYTLQSAVLAPLFYFAIQRPSLWLFRPFNVRWIQFVGVLSYSFYLVHDIVIAAIEQQAPQLPLPVLVVLAGSVSFGLSYAFHRWIERPAAQMRRRQAVAAGQR